MTYDFSVIGSGASGLTASLILAKNGYKVALVEKADRTGPLLRGFSRGGLRFNTGFHYSGGLGNGEILDVLFRYLGLSERLQTVSFDPDCFDLFRFLDCGFEFAFPWGFDRIKDRFYDYFPNQKTAIDRYLAAIKTQCEARPYLNLDIEIDQWQFLKNINGQTVNEFLDELTEDSRLKHILSMHCLLHGVPGNEAPFSNHSCIVGPYYESVHYIKGGGLSLVEAFEVELKNWGVDIFCGQGADEILFSSRGSVKGVKLRDNQVLDCKGCVCTAHPRCLLRLVPESLFRSSFIKRIMNLDETVSAYILYGEYQTFKGDFVHSNIYLTPYSDNPLNQLDMSLENRVIYISFFEQEGQGKTKNGFIAICPANMDEVSRWSDSFTGQRSSDYYEFKEEIAQKLKYHIEISCPELKGKIDSINLSTPLTIRDYVNSPFGSLYGVKHKVGQFNPLPVTRLEGLFLAGQSSVAPGILGAVISGFVTCGNIFGHENIRKGLRECN